MLLAALAAPGASCTSELASSDGGADAGRTEPAAAIEATPREVSLTDAACERCHAQAADEWRASAHRTAFSDEVFQAEWLPTRGNACVTCHAPLADPDAPGGLEAEAGISCVTCHVRDGEILGSREVASDAPHAVRVEPALARGEACARCHDFPFARVAPTPHHDEDPLQATHTEASEVPERGACPSCHARTEDGRVHHRFAGARDPVLLAGALDVDVRARRAGGGVELELRLRSRAGHAVPTGDMYRRLAIRAWPAARRPPAAPAVLLGRHFENVGSERREVLDDRVPARGERVVTLVVSRTRRVRWRIDWEALDPRLAERRWLPTEDVVRVVAEGEAEVE